MLKFFYRLKRRGGAVLFAVIAIMSLLIAMAITAYFTARSSYQTVVSNYDFSQMYLSAISVSDMMIEAITQDAYVGKGTENDFDGLKSAIQGLKKTKNASITGTSSNVYGKSGKAIIDALQTDSTIIPVESGVLDAVEVTITHKDNKPEVDALTKAPTGLTIYIFEIKTTAYYRDNSITVTDIVCNKAGKTTSKGTSNPFNTFFTATGQAVTGASVDKDHTRAVVIQSHEISDNAYFENDYTVFPNGNNNDFYGGIQATGSVYLDKFTCHIPKPTATSRHDWWIGGDLVTGANSNDINLNGNNLYVGNDLILGGNGASIEAGDVYVMGDLYLCSGGTVNITGNLYVKGNIYFTKDSDVESRVNTVGTLSGTYLGLNSTGVLKVSGDLKVNGSYNPSDANSKKKDGTWDPASITVPVSSVVSNTNDDKYEEKISDSGLEAAVTSKSKTTTFSTYTAGQETLDNKLVIDFSQLEPEVNKDGQSTGRYFGTISASKEGEAYVELSPDGTLTVNVPYADDGYFLDIRYDTIQSYQKETEKTRKVYTEGHMETVEVEEDDWSKAYWDPVTQQNIVPKHTVQRDVWVPGEEVEETYKEITTFSMPSPVNYTYNFGTKSGETMPVVLAANMKSGDAATDSRGYNAFAWKTADKYDTNGGESKVQLVDNDSLTSHFKEAGTSYDSAKGNVLFELGNYEKTSGKYVSYTPDVTSATSGDETIDIVDYSNLYNNVETATYITSQKETVGTKKQVDTVSGNWQSESTITGMLKSGSSVPQSGYDNRVMIVSNKNGGVAVDGARLDNTICGYIYAPNGVYNNASGSGNSPIFGGMIVSSYKTNLSYFVYAEPKPSVISQLLGSLTESSPSGGDSTPAEGYWILSGLGKNYLG